MSMVRVRCTAKTIYQHPEDHMKSFQLSMICAAALLATAASAATAPQAANTDLATIVAKKEDKSREGAGHPVADDLATTVARREAEKRGGEGAGHPVADQPTDGIVA